MADDVTLLRCHCGAGPEVSQEAYTRGVAIFCVSCGEVTRFYDTAAEAYDVWNEARRNDAVAERDARIAALEAQLADARDCIDLFNRIIVRAECKWKEAHPDSAFYPDVPDLIVWLKEQVDTLSARRCETCKQYLSGYWCMTHRYSPNVNASCSDWQGEDT